MTNISSKQSDDDPAKSCLLLQTVPTEVAKMGNPVSICDVMNSKHVAMMDSPVPICNDTHKKYIIWLHHESIIPSFLSVHVWHDTINRVASCISNPMLKAKFVSYVLHPLPWDPMNISTRTVLSIAKQSFVQEGRTTFATLISSQGLPHNFQDHLMPIGTEAMRGKRSYADVARNANPVATMKTATLPCLQKPTLMSSLCHVRPHAPEIRCTKAKSQLEGQAFQDWAQHLTLPTRPHKTLQVCNVFNVFDNLSNDDADDLMCDEQQLAIESTGTHTIANKSVKRQKRQELSSLANDDPLFEPHYELKQSDDPICHACTQRFDPALDMMTHKLDRLHPKFYDYQWHFRFASHHDFDPICLYQDPIVQCVRQAHIRIAQSTLSYLVDRYQQLNSPKNCFDTGTIANIDQMLHMFATHSRVTCFLRYFIMYYGLFNEQAWTRLQDQLSVEPVLAFEKMKLSQRPVQKQKMRLKTKFNTGKGKHKKHSYATDLVICQGCIDQHSLSVTNCLTSWRDEGQTFVLSGHARFTAVKCTFCTNVVNKFLRVRSDNQLNVSTICCQSSNMYSRLALRRIINKDDNLSCQAKHMHHSNATIFWQPKECESTDLDLTVSPTLLWHPQVSKLDQHHDDTITQTVNLPDVCSGPLGATQEHCANDVSQSVMPTVCYDTIHHSFEEQSANHCQHNTLLSPSTPSKGGQAYVSQTPGNDLVPSSMNNGHSCPSLCSSKDTHRHELQFHSDIATPFDEGCLGKLFQDVIDLTSQGLELPSSTQPSHTCRVFSLTDSGVDIPPLLSECIHKYVPDFPEKALQSDDVDYLSYLVGNIFVFSNESTYIVLKLSHFEPEYPCFYAGDCKVEFPEWHSLHHLEQSLLAGHTFTIFGVQMKGNRITLRDVHCFLAHAPPPQSVEQIRFGECCSGMGCFSKILHSFELQTFYASDKNPIWREYCQSNAQHFQQANIHHTDTIIQFLKHRINAIAAGIPCPAWSRLGDQKGFLDPRGTTIIPVLRLAHILGIQFLSLECTPTVHKDEGFQTILRSVAKINSLKVLQGVFQLSDTWVSDRQRWLCQMLPGYTCIESLQQLLPRFPFSFDAFWKALQAQLSIDVDTLILTDTDIQILQLDGQSLDDRDITKMRCAPCFVHSYSQPHLPCPCSNEDNCRNKPLSLKRLQQSVQGCIVPHGQSYRWLHPKEVAFLLGFGDKLHTSNNLRLELAGLGQCIPSFFTCILASSIVDHFASPSVCSQMPEPLVTPSLMFCYVNSVTSIPKSLTTPVAIAVLEQGDKEVAIYKLPKHTPVSELVIQSSRQQTMQEPHIVIDMDGTVIPSNYPVGLLRNGFVLLLPEESATQFANSDLQRKAIEFQQQAFFFAPNDTSVPTWSIFESELQQILLCQEANTYHVHLIDRSIMFPWNARPEEYRVHKDLQILTVLRFLEKSFPGRRFWATYQGSMRTPKTLQQCMSNLIVRATLPGGAPKGKLPPDMVAVMRFLHDANEENQQVTFYFPWHQRFIHFFTSPHISVAQFCSFLRDTYEFTTVSLYADKQLMTNKTKLVDHTGRAIHVYTNYHNEIYDLLQKTVQHEEAPVLESPTYSSSSSAYFATVPTVQSGSHVTNDHSVPLEEAKAGIRTRRWVRRPDQDLTSASSKMAIESILQNALDQNLEFTVSETQSITCKSGHAPSVSFSCADNQTGMSSQPLFSPDSLQAQIDEDITFIVVHTAEMAFSTDLSCRLISARTIFHNLKFWFRFPATKTWDDVLSFMQTCLPDMRIQLADPYLGSSVSNTQSPAMLFKFGSSTFYLAEGLAKYTSQLRSKLQDEYTAFTQKSSLRSDMQSSTINDEMTHHVPVIFSDASVQSSRVKHIEMVSQTVPDESNAVEVFLPQFILEKASKFQNWIIYDYFASHTLLNLEQSPLAKIEMQFLPFRQRLIMYIPKTWSHSDLTKELNRFIPVHFSCDFFDYENLRTVFPHTMRRGQVVKVQVAIRDCVQLPQDLHNDKSLESLQLHQNFEKALSRFQQTAPFSSKRIFLKLPWTLKRQSFNVPSYWDVNDLLVCIQGIHPRISNHVRTGGNKPCNAYDILQEHETYLIFEIGCRGAGKGKGKSRDVLQEHDSWAMYTSKSSDQAGSSSHAPKPKLRDQADQISDLLEQMHINMRYSHSQSRNIIQKFGSAKVQQILNSDDPLQSLQQHARDVHFTLIPDTLKLKNISRKPLMTESEFHDLLKYLEFPSDSFLNSATNETVSMIALGDITRNSSGVSICSLDQAMPFLEFKEPFSLGALAMLVPFIEKPTDDITSSIKVTTISVALVDTRDTTTRVFQCLFFQLGQVKVMKKTAEGLLHIPEKVTKINFHFHKVDLGIAWDAASAAPMQHLLNTFPSLKNFIITSKITSTSRNLYVNVLITVRQLHLDTVLKLSGEHNIFLAPQADDGSPHTEYVPIWFPGKTFEQVLARSRMDEHTLGTIKRVISKNQQIKITYGIRVKVTDFDRLSKLLLEDASDQTYIAMPKRFVVSKIPLGTDSTDLRLILESNCHIKEHWKWKEIRPLGEYAWLIGAIDDPPISILSFCTETGSIDITIKPYQVQFQSAHRHRPERSKSVPVPFSKEVTAMPRRPHSSAPASEYADRLKTLETMFDSLQTESRAGRQELHRQLHHAQQSFDANLNRHVSKLESDIESLKQDIPTRSSLMQDLQTVLLPSIQAMLAGMKENPSNIAMTSTLCPLASKIPPFPSEPAGTASSFQGQAGATKRPRTLAKSGTE